VLPTDSQQTVNVSVPRLHARYGVDKRRPVSSMHEAVSSAYRGCVKRNRVAEPMVMVKRSVLRMSSEGPLPALVTGSAPRFGMALSIGWRSPSDESPRTKTHPQRGEGVPT
jgi:hypothetical protein